MNIHVLRLCVTSRLAVNHLRANAINLWQPDSDDRRHMQDIGLWLPENMSAIGMTETFQSHNLFQRDDLLTFTDSGVSFTVGGGYSVELVLVNDKWKYTKQ